MELKRYIFCCCWLGCSIITNYIMVDKMIISSVSLLVFCVVLSLVLKRTVCRNFNYDCGYLFILTSSFALPFILIFLKIYFPLFNCPIYFCSCWAFIAAPRLSSCESRDHFFWIWCVNLSLQFSGFEALKI